MRARTPRILSLSFITDFIYPSLGLVYLLLCTCRTTPLLNLTLAVPVDGGVVNMTSQPKGIW
jgi:hypothetical protein